MSMTIDLSRQQKHKHDMYVHNCLLTVEILLPFKDNEGSGDGSGDGSGSTDGSGDGSVSGSGDGSGNEGTGKEGIAYYTTFCRILLAPIVIEYVS